MKNPSVVTEVTAHMNALLSSKDYPCVAAVSSMARKEYHLGIYKDLGLGSALPEFAKDLLNFIKIQQKTKSQFLSFWAVFKTTPQNLDEADFETRMWKELSLLSAFDPQPWDPQFSSDPKDKNFNFSFGGKTLFVVGLHDKSSRRARQFPYSALIFNVYEQFQQLMDNGKYDAMVKTNRLRDLKFQGSVNPMVEKYGEDFEAIQYSGKNNPESWKCPFHRS